MKSLVSIIISKEFTFEEGESIDDLINTDAIIQRIDMDGSWYMDDIEVENIEE